MLLVIACVACGSSYPEPKVGLREAACKTQVLLYALGDNEPLVEKVLNGDMTIADAVSLVGGLEEDATAAIAQYHECEPVQAPPPAPGDKVL
jgi:hypothetical protein